MFNNAWIKLRRDRLSISQEELARRLQIAGQDHSRATVSHWETGRNSLPLHDPDFTQALATALEMTVYQVLREVGYELDTKHTPLGEEAAMIVDQLSPVRARIFVNALKQIVAIDTARDENDNPVIDKDEPLRRRKLST